MAATRPSRSLAPSLATSRALNPRRMRKAGSCNGRESHVSGAIRRHSSSVAQANPCRLRTSTASSPQAPGSPRFRDLQGVGIEPNGPDFMAVGDLSTLTTVPWQRGTARIVCEGHVKGEPWAYGMRAYAPKARSRRLTDAKMDLNLQGLNRSSRCSSGR